jgi:hypothetical protein
MNCCARAAGADRTAAVATATATAINLDFISGSLPSGFGPGK